jgi:hypothetical protein
VAGSTIRAGHADQEGWSQVAEPTVDRRARRGPRSGGSRPGRAAADGRAEAIDQAVVRTRESVRDRAVRLTPLLVLVIAIVLVMLGQLAEDLADTEPLQLLARPLDAQRRWTLIVAVVYMLVIGRIIERMVNRSLATLDALINVDPDRFRDYMARMRRPGLGVDLILLAISAGVVLVLFLALRTSLPIDDTVTNTPVYLPANGVMAIAIVVQYTLVGWAVLALVWSTISRARALGELSREPLEIDVFDTSNVLPLGNIALATALAPAGVIVILLFGFGAPSMAVSWTLLLLVTLASLLALLLPLRGIHRQMDAAKESALASLNARLRASYEEASAAVPPSPEDTTRLNHRVATLVNLRKTVGEMTTWPFRDTLALGRAVLIATAPLIYTVINELITFFVIGPLTRS